MSGPSTSPGRKADLSTPCPNPPPAGRWFRWAVAFVWMTTGLLVLHPSYRQIGREYLDLAGLPHALMYLACAAEVILALAIVSVSASRWLTWLQVVTVSTFTLILATVEPMLMVHPYGILTKNIPLLTLVIAAWRLESRGWTPRAEAFLRCGMAIIWITEGLFPKVLFQQAMELDSVVRSGLITMDPARFLLLMGWAQMASGVAALVCRGRALSLILAVQLMALVVLPVMASRDELDLWLHPFGPLTKNVPIIVGTMVVFLRVTPMLSANWSHILVVSFRIPTEWIKDRCPAGVELELSNGQALLSFVSLDFEDTCICYLPAWGHRQFPDINLRTYVHQGTRRGVVFIRELVPSPLTAWVARTLFGEPFHAAEIASCVERSGGVVRLTRHLQIGDQRHTIRASARPPLELPAEDSETHLLIERYWGFGKTRWGTRRFRVTHPPWKTYQLDACELDIDWARIYGREWAALASMEPFSIVLAAGSRVNVWYPV